MAARPGGPTQFGSEGEGVCIDSEKSDSILAGMDLVYLKLVPKRVKYMVARVQW